MGNSAMREQFMSRFLSHRLFSSTTTTLLLSTSLFVSASLLTMSPATAQDRSSLIQRIEYLENQMHGRSGGSSAAAGLEVRIAAFEEELRTLQGRLEELDHQQQRVNEKLELLQKDNEARLAAIEARLPVAAAPVIGGSAPAPAAAPAPVIDNTPPAAYSTEPAPAALPVETHSEAAPAPTMTPPPQAQNSNSSPYSNAREHYDAAFKALNQSDYPKASQLFSTFIAAYPKDVLIGNAYYWSGETFYVQRQYAKAAEQFRLGFETMPEGPKAPDNLLKLGMSLSLLNRNKEACVVLGQLLKKYSGQSEVIERKAKMESTRLQCGG
jgi:tol-pal system protein YbgF